MTRAILAALLCASAAQADPATHHVIIHTPGGDVASAPMTRAECMEKAAAIHGRVFPIPIQEDGVPVIVMVRLFASCVPLGVAS